MNEGQLLNGRYRLIRRLGEGGMGDVWLARDQQLPREVAIKGLRPKPGAVPGERRRLELEAEMLAGLSNPRIVQIIDTFREGAQLYLVMQYIPGRDLQRAVEDGGLSTAKKTAILIDVLEALAYLHDETPVVHRDLKPANILLDRRDRASVTDFGIARSLADPDRTKSAYILGTFDYMAPEVRDGHKATPASDVWSFGAVALFLFTGRKYDHGIPDGDFAGPLTAPIRGALSRDPALRPSADSLLDSFRLPVGPTATRVAGPTAPIPVPPPSPARTSTASKAAVGAKRIAWLPIALLLVALAGVGALAANTVFRQPAQPPVQNAAPLVAAPAPTTATPSTPPPTPSPSPTPTPTPAPTMDSPSPTPPAFTGPQWVYLASTDYIDAEIVGRPGRCDGGCTGFRLHPTSIAGTMYPQAWVMRMDGDGKKSTTTWNAYTKCTKLEATIGLSDDSQSVQAHFLLQREGGATDDFGVLRTGQSKKITVDLTGVFRFTVVSYLAVPQTLNTTSASAWGDIRMLCTGLPTQQP